MADESRGGAGSLLGIKVLAGLHVEAIIGLEPGVRRVLGGGGEADVLLLDDDVAECQCALLWEEGGRMTLEVISPGMSAYGKVLPPGRCLDIKVGATLDVCGVSLLVVYLQADSTKDGLRLARSPSETELRCARRHVLRQLHPRFYVLDLIAAAGTGYRSACIAIIVAIAAGWGAYMLGQEADVIAWRGEAIADVHRLFPAVEVTVDIPNAVTIYEGYVEDQRELNQLRSNILGMDEGRSIVRVVPMDVLTFNASMWLEDHYEGAQVQVVAPGRLKVVLASALGIKRLDGWDFAATVRRLRQELPEIKAATIEVASAASMDVTVPAVQMGLSVVPLGHEAAYIVGADGLPLFEGAAISEGQFTDVSACGVSLQSRQTGSVVRLSTQQDGCSDQHLPPVQAGLLIESKRGNKPP